MLREQIKSICAECGLNQKGLAEVMGVKHQRVLDMTSGRVAKLTREEGEALIRKLHVRAEWLATGQPPMRQSAQEQHAEDVLMKVGNAAQAAAALDLDLETGRKVADFLYYVAAGNAAAAKQALAALTALSPEEAAFLDNYRNTKERGRKALREMGAAVAERSRADVKKKGCA